MGKAIVHLVDDDPAVRGTLARLLESGGYDVMEYASGAALLDTANSITSGYILLDVDMPGPEGFAIQKTLTARAVDIPVIMMTGSGDLTVLALKAGVTDFLQKPFGRFELLSVLDQLEARLSSRRPANGAAGLPLARQAGSSPRHV